MDFAFQTTQKITDLLKFEIIYIDDYKSYLFNHKWANEYSEEYFNDKLTDIENVLGIHLKNGRNQAEYLQDLLNPLYKRLEFLRKHNSNSLEFFNLYSNITSGPSDFLKAPKNNQVEYERFKNYKNEIGSAYNNLFDYLNYTSDELNSFKSLEDFEKGILLYSISLYKRAIRKLYQYIKQIHENVNYIDFKNYNLEELHLPITNTAKKRLCHINLDKKSVAHLFRILTEEKVFVFDELNDKKNVYEMKRFVEENFTYQNSKKERIFIEKFNREYAEISANQGLADNERHIKFIDYLILKLKRRKNNL